MSGQFQFHISRVTLLAVALLFSFVSHSQSLVELESSTNAFLQSHLKGGGIDYAGISKDKSQLTDLRARYAAANTIDISPKQHLSFWINAYNITVIGSIMDHWPTTSPQSISGFFDSEKHTIAGIELTINQIEKEQILKIHADARVHFVLVCGAKGCPQISSEAFTADNVDAQLNERTKVALDDPNFMRIDDEKQIVGLSQIFNWYEKDFKASHPSVKGFINAHRSTPLPEKFKIEHYSYDWTVNTPATGQKIKSNDTEAFDGGTVNLQAYTPSQLLKEGQWEVKVFNNLYTDNASFNAEGVSAENSRRQSYFTSFIQAQFGTKSRFNFGVDFQLKSVRLHESPSSSPLELFQFENGTNGRTALSYIGPKIKLAPFKKLSGFSIQTTLFIPVANDQQGSMNNRPWLSHDGYQWWVQMFYDQKITTDLRAFFEVDAFTSIDRKFDANNTSLLTPAKAFLSYFATGQLTFYGMGEFGPNWGEGGISSYYTQAGLGGKYQIVPGVEIEALYTNFPLGKNSGAGNTFNIGLRILK